MWWQLLAFELRFHARQPIGRACALAYLVLGAAMARGRFGGPEVLGDAPSSLALFAGLLSLASYVVTSLLAGGAILRDREHGMEAIVFTTGLDRWSFVTSRAAGLVLATLTCVSAGIVGLAIGRFVPGIDPARFGPFSPSAYLWAWAVIVVPNVLFGVVVVFGAGALSRSALVTFVSGLGLYAFYWVGSILGNSPLMAQSRPLAPGEANLGALLEPTGMVALVEQTRFWSTTEHNLQLVPLAGLLLQNRLIWIALALLTFAATVRLFSFRVESRRGAGREASPRPTPSAPAPIPVSLTATVAAVPLGDAISAQTRLLLRSYGRHLPLIGALVLWIPFVFISVTDVLRSGDLDTTLRATSELVIPALLEPIRLFGSLLVVYFASEVCWRERALRFDGILDAVPAPIAARVVSRVLVLVALVAGLVATATATSLVIQVVLGEIPTLAPYVALWSRGAIPLIALAGVAVLLHALLPNRWVGLAATIAVTIFGSGLLAPTAGLIEHPLLKLGAMPRYRGSAMAGTFDSTAVAWWALYWVVWAILAVALARVAVRRGALRSGWSRPTVAVAVGAVMVGIGAGGHIASATRAAHSFFTSGADREWRAAYERHTAGIEPTSVQATAVTLRGDFEPQTRALRLSAQIDLINIGDQALERVTLEVDPRLAVERIALGGVPPEAVDPTFGSTTFALATPLKPGARAHLDFVATLETSPFARLDPEAYVVPKASYVEVHKLLPSPYPRQDWWVDDPIERRRLGLPERPEPTPLRETPPPQPDWVVLDATWSTSADQQIVAAGVDVRRWQDGGRSYFHSRSNGPMPLALGVASATYEVQRSHHQGIDIAVYHSPGHGAAGPDLLAAAAATLDLGSRNLSPYPDPQLVIAEIPSFSERFGATSNPAAIFAVENRLFLERAGQPHLAGRAVAHEVGHQWWGRELDPAIGPGYQMLTEVLAVVVEGMVSDSIFDSTTTAANLERLAGVYFAMRGYGPTEAPLVDTYDQPAVHYFKGALVAHALEQHLGRDRLLAVLRDFLADHRYPAKPIAWELAQRLEAAAPGDLRPAVRELLAEVVTYELELHEVGEPTSGFVDLDLEARRLGQTRSPTGFWLEIGLRSSAAERTIHRVWVDHERTRYQLPWAGAAQPKVELDPRRLLIRPPT